MPRVLRRRTSPTPSRLTLRLLRRCPYGTERRASCADPKLAFAGFPDPDSELPYEPGRAVPVGGGRLRPKTVDSSMRTRRMAEVGVEEHSTRAGMRKGALLEPHVARLRPVPRLSKTGSPPHPVRHRLARWHHLAALDVEVPEQGPLKVLPEQFGEGQAAAIRLCLPATAGHVRHEFACARPPFRVRPGNRHRHPCRQLEKRRQVR